jgi:hypothetical protein
VVFFSRRAAYRDEMGLGLGLGLAIGIENGLESWKWKRTERMLAAAAAALS